MVLTQSFPIQLGYWNFASGNLPYPCVDTMAPTHLWLLVFGFRFPFGSYVVSLALVIPDISLFMWLYPFCHSVILYTLLNFSCYWSSLIPSDKGWKSPAGGAGRRSLLHTLCCCQTHLAIQCDACLEFPSSCWGFEGWEMFSVLYVLCHLFYEVPFIWLLLTELNHSSPHSHITFYFLYLCINLVIIS